MRPRTAVNQSPGGGSIYPLLSDHALVPLVLDFYLSYEDEACSYAAPFCLRWLSGFGTNSVAAPGGMPTPTHEYDLLVTDANDEVVFDSTQADDINVVEWGDDRKVAEWIVGEAVARIVFYVDEAASFDTEMAQEDALLDPQTYRRLPKRVVALRVGVTELRGNVQIQAGFNVALDAILGERVDGTAFTNAITLDGVAGAGLGRVDGCEEGDPLLRTINQIQPDASGNFIIEADDCFRWQLPLLVTQEDDGPRTAEYAENDLTTEEAQAAFKLYDDCLPCCDCHFFARTYIGLSRAWDQWLELSEEAERIRDVYESNRDRWLAQLACRVNNPAKLVTSSEPNCKGFMGGLYCNLSEACLRDMEVRFTVKIFRNGHEVKLPIAVRPQLTVADATLESSSTRGEEAYTPLTLISILRFFADFLNARETIVAKARICYPCQVGDTMVVIMTVHSPDPEPPPELAHEVILPALTMTADLLEHWADEGIAVSDPVRAIMTHTLPINASAGGFDCPCG
jgi:hypothetical protein